MKDAPQQPISRQEALEALTRSGYLLESRVESVLRSAEFRVEANNLIPDESGMRRELDIWAGWARGYDFGPQGESSLSLELVIECVNAPQPIAFITKERLDPFLERSDRWESLKLVGNPQEIDTAPQHTWTWLSRELELDRFHHYRSNRISTQYCSLQRKQANAQWMALHREEDHQTLRKLCVATNHYINDTVVAGYNTDAGWSLTLLYPVLVVQGEIFEVRPSRRSARIVRSRHVQFFTRQAVAGEENNYQIDVITESYLPTYLAMLFREMRLMNKRFNAKYDHLRDFRRTRERNYAAYLEHTRPLREAKKHRDPAV